MMRQQKFHLFISIDNLDKVNKRMLVYSLKDQKSYIATTEVKAPVLSISLGILVPIIDLSSFLLEQKKLVKQLWGVLASLFTLTLLTAGIYWLTLEATFLVGTGMVYFSLPLLYFTGLHRRNAVINKLLVQGGL